jgi:hypothetical protein
LAADETEYVAAMSVDLSDADDLIAFHSGTLSFVHRACHESFFAVAAALVGAVATGEDVTSRDMAMLALTVLPGVMMIMAIRTPL